MTKIWKFNDSIIITILGIGYINEGMILGEFDDIHLFSTPNKLITCVGLPPSVYQFGNFQAKKTRISKYKSTILRYTLVNATRNVIKNNASFKTYYNTKMAKIIIPLDIAQAARQNHLENNN